jgi:hypothetical protein
MDVTTPFMLDTLKTWGVDVTNLNPEVHTVPPREQSYHDLSEDRDNSKAGEYTLNPEMQGLDLEKLKAFIPDLSAFNGKPIHEVMQHVADTYGAKYHIPGIEYWKWVIENPVKSHTVLTEDSNIYFFPGSTLRNRDGEWCVPYAGWFGSSFSLFAYWLSDGWNSFYRVVLLEK